MPHVLISGGSGLIGQHLCQVLTKKGYEVSLLSRTPSSQGPFPRYAWNPAEGTIDKAAVKRADYIINLAGAGIADKLWSASRRRELIDSRVQSIALLQKTLEKLNHKPKAFISASAVGFYGNRGDELLTEDAVPGKGFMSEVCQRWEEAAQKVADTGIRTVIFRIGIVLSSKGGTLPKIMQSLPLRVASYFGNGKQWYPWIHIEDMVRLFLFAIENDALNGTFNATAPNPEICKKLVQETVSATGKRAFIVPSPSYSLRMIMGEMADILLAGQRTTAAKIQKVGFQFQFPELSTALQSIVQKINSPF